MRHRFAIEPAPLGSGSILLEGTLARQIRRVLRLAVGDRVGLFCGDGWEHDAVLVAVGDNRAEALIETSRQPETELRCRLTVGVSILKGERLDWVVQKLTELGVAEIVFLQTERVIAAPEGPRWTARLARYAAIAREATEQCGRVRFPVLGGPLTLANYLRDGGDHLTAFVDPAATMPLRSIVAPTCEALRLAVGPEGGFSPLELKLAREIGAATVSLGPRVLRSETAAVVAATLVAELSGG